MIHKFLQGSERVYGLGYQPNPYDGRDRPIAKLLEQTARGSSSLDSTIGSPPSELDITDSVLFVGNQNPSSTCVPWALSQSMTMRQVIMDPSTPPTRPSVLVPYWDYRPSKIEDAGMYPRAIMNGVRNDGYCSEESWPFDPKKVYDAPPPRVRALSFDQKGKLEYYLMNPEGFGLREGQCRAALAAGFPFNFAIPVNRSFADYTGGIWTFEGDPTTAPWHYLTACGYNDYGLMHVNSWGAWGTVDKRGRPGFGWISWSMVREARMSSDFFAITYAYRVTG